jgi:hypothetical protein
MFTAMKKSYVRPSMKFKSMDSLPILAGSGLPGTTGMEVAETTGVSANPNYKVAPDEPILSKGTSKNIWSE